VRLLIPLVALLGCAPKLPPQPGVPAGVRAWQDAVDWDVAGDEAVGLLQSYLQVDTSNPPGGETEGARWLAAALDRDGIGWSIHEFAPGRGSIVARLRAEAPTEAPLCLLSHIDVVPAAAAEWPAETSPFSGVIDAEGFLWGRGALDMKALGALELHTMALLARTGAPLRRDVVLIAVADEEVDNQGMLHVVEALWDELRCGHVLNEGAYGVRDALVDGQTVHAVSVGEKGVLWLEVVARGEPGHGSTPLPDTAIERLRRAMDAIEARSPRPEWHPMMMELLGRVGTHAGGLTGFVLARPGLVRSVARGRLMGNPLTRASLTTTVNLTGLRGAEGFNVVPHEAVAAYDIRLLPGVTPEAVVDELEGLVRGIPEVEVRVVRHFPAAVSPWQGDPLYDAIVAQALDGRPDAVAGPFLSIGFTDSIFARQQGAVAYGYTPMAITADLLATMHGHDERAPVSEIREGARRLFGVVVQAAVDPSAPPRPPAVVARPVPEPSARAVWPVGGEGEVGGP
jgi:acetylornithine deacetylase/succinyl-diaminopimelate desuccinylase-like protein